MNNMSNAAGEIQGSAHPPSSSLPLTLMEALYDDGRILQAFHEGEKIAPFAQWRGAEARVLAGRIALNLGAPRTGRMLHLRAFREHPNHAEAAYFYARALHESRGPAEAIAFCRKTGDLPDAAIDIRADWLAFRGSLATVYRDFETAEDLMGEAERLAPRRAWLCIERSRLLEAEDRYDEALAAARRSLEIHPWFRSGVHTIAHLLQVLDRDEEALDLLQQASARIESAAMLQQLAMLQSHLRRYGDAMETLSRIDLFCPLRERKFTQSIAAQRSNAAYYNGNYPQAISFARQSEHEFMLKVAQKLQEQIDSGKSPTRVELEFPFVRQHHMTCAPATVSAVSRYWNCPADHLELVDAICYDGTPAHSQRRWAESNRWVAREFTVTWESALALIDRKLPFMLATTTVTSAHLQAVIGYDTMRGTIICRDPYQYYASEFVVDLMVRYNASSGPRGMVIVPAAQAGLLDGLQLPDSDLFDLVHEIESALARHDRPAAESARLRLLAAAPEHRLAHHARWALASYDADHAGRLEAIDGLLALYPDDQRLLLQKVYALRTLERRDLIASVLQKARDLKGSDPIFLMLCADEVRVDFGNNDRVVSLLRKALRRQPTQGASLDAMGDALWSRGQLEDATAHYYLCACVDDTNENAAQTYFSASRHLRQTDRALGMLRRRFKRLGKRSSRPACTLFWALDTLDRGKEALEVLDRARELRPDDGGLLLYTAGVHGRRGNLPLARSILQAARGKSHQQFWLRRAAELAVYQGDLKEALDLWKKVLEAEPLAEDANREVAQLIAQTQSPAAAAQFLLGVHQQFPHNTAIQTARIVWLRSQGAAAVVAAARELVAQRPGNVWARVELSLSLTDLGEFAEALQHAQAALAITSTATNAHNAAGLALCSMHQLDEGREAYRRAIRISVDFTAALHHLIDSHSDADGKRAELSFILGELVRQVTFGEGLMAYRRAASPLLPPGEILATLRQAQQARPDLWQVWSAIITQQINCNQLDDAISTARQAVDRFPLLPRVWLDLSSVCDIRGDRDGQIEALNHCLGLCAFWSLAERHLADAYQRAGHPDKAKATLLRAIARDPLDSENHRDLAQLLWKAGERDAAIKSAQHAVNLNPENQSAWDCLSSWSAQQGALEAFIQFTRDLCRRRAGEAVAWLALARALRGKESVEERICACDTAISLAPLDDTPHDVKIRILLESGQREKAIAACDPPEFGGHPPCSLQGRRAWIYAQSGDRDRAISEMREVLKKNIRYYWGWRQLITWRWEANKPAEYLEAATEMIAQFPHDWVALNNLAAAQFQTKDRAAAKATLARALAIAPDNSYALEQMFDAQIQDRELDGAQVTLELIRQHERADFCISREVILAAASGDKSKAADSLGKLCGVIKDDGRPLNDSLQAMDKAQMRDEATGTLNSIVAGNPKASEKIIAPWSERICQNGQWKQCAAWMKKQSDESPQWQAAAESFINVLAKKRNSAPVLKLIKRRKAALRRTSRLWGLVGYALVELGYYSAAVRWLRDWEARSDCEPWMLVNLTSGLHRTGFQKKAIKVHRHAVSLKPDHTTLKHIVWLAFEEAASGAPGEQMSQFAARANEALNWEFPMLRELVQALTPLCKAPGGDAAEPTRAQQSSAARRAIGRAPKMYLQWRKRSDLRYAMRRASRRVVAYHPSLKNRLWRLGVLLQCIPITIR